MMKDHNRRAGQSTRDMAEIRYRSRVRFVLLTGGVILAISILVLILGQTTLGVSGLGVFGLLFLARLVTDYMEARAKRMMREERRAIRGAKAEEKIGLSLEELDEDYLVIHDVESPYGNIDHIVISKQGEVFLIETKAHGGRVSVENGRLLVNDHDPEKDFIAQALRNAYWLRDKIRDVINTEIWITPIVAFSNAFVERTQPVKGVTVINKKYLLDVLQRSPSRTQNPLVWENQESIVEALWDPNAPSRQVASRNDRTTGATRRVLGAQIGVK